MILRMSPIFFILLMGLAVSCASKQPSKEPGKTLDQTRQDKSGANGVSKTAVAGFFTADMFKEPSEEPNKVRERFETSIRKKREEFERAVKGEDESLRRAKRAALETEIREQRTRFEQDYKLYSKAYVERAAAEPKKPAETKGTNPELDEFSTIPKKSTRLTTPDEN